MEVKPLNSMGSLQPWLQVVRAVNPSASSQVTRKPCFEYDSVLLFENSSIDRVVPWRIKQNQKALRKLEGKFLSVPQKFFTN